MNHLQNLLSRRAFLNASVIAVGSGVIAGRDAVAAAPSDDLRSGSIDAHVHVWTADTQRYPLAAGYAKERMAIPSFTPEEFFAHARPAGVTRTVLIQMSYYGFDNSYMLDVMRAHRGVFSGVAIVDATANPETAMRELARHGVRGFRIVAGTQVPDRWLSGEAMAAMWKCAASEGLAICPLMNPQFLPALDAMCRRFPQTQVAVSFCPHRDRRPDPRPGRGATVRPGAAQARAGQALRVLRLGEEAVALLGSGSDDPPPAGRLRPRAADVGQRLPVPGLGRPPLPGFHRLDPPAA